MEIPHKTKFKLRPAFKNPNWNLWMDWDKLCLNLRFTVEKKMENIHKG